VSDDICKICEDFIMINERFDKFGNVLPLKIDDISFSLNDGFSMDDAIIITGATCSYDGVGGEYKYLSQRFGERNKDWTLKMQVLLEKDGKAFDQMQVIYLREQTEFSIFFEITEFFGNDII
ncbi:MAG: hypothetical protein K8S87_05435, partial [Planctomycetes bacterium]|nr:hypothetical protein [Planctomycetota bacterium]